MQDYRITCDPGNEAFDLDNSPFYLVARADYQYHEDIDNVLRKYGMDRSKYRVLHVLRQRNTCSIGDLAERTTTKRSTMSRIVDRMRGEGLVETSHNGDDQRITDVTLLPAGREALAHVLRVGSRQFHRAVEGLTNEQIGAFIETLHHVIKNLNRLPLE